MKEKAKNAMDRAAWFIIGSWIVILRFVFAPGGKGLGGVICPAILLTLISTWIGWFVGLLKGHAGRGAFYGFAAGLLVFTVFGIVIVAAAGWQGLL
jgi:hypothetical protein